MLDGGHGSQQEARARRVFEIYDVCTGASIESGYSRQEAHNAISWCWNTGGDIAYLGVRRDPTIPAPEWQRESAARARRTG